MQGRRKGRYIGETFLQREDARKWAVEAEKIGSTVLGPAAVSGYNDLKA